MGVLVGRAEEGRESWFIGSEKEAEHHRDGRTPKQRVKSHLQIGQNSERGL